MGAAVARPLPCGGEDSGGEVSADLRAFYLEAKQRVVAAGYGWEAQWQATRDFAAITESDFLRELAWVILCSGFREKVIRGKFPAISAAFCGWDSARQITEHAAECRQKALEVFGNRRKVDAIIAGAAMVDMLGWAQLKISLRDKMPRRLLSFPMIGEVTMFHLAKNLGAPIAKPDRHLVGMAFEHGYLDVQEFCERISNLTGDPVPVVDIVLWRYAAEKIRGAT